MSTGAILEIGKTYQVKCQRKGTFTMRMVKFCETWATGVVVAGKAPAMLSYNEKEEGEEVTVRRSFCSFTEKS